MILGDVGGQQLVGNAPLGKSAGPHWVRSGGDIGFAKAKGSVGRLDRPPYSPPRPIRTFLLLSRFPGGGC